MNKIQEIIEKQITGEQLHIWYLEAIKEVEPDSFNPDAVKPYAELTTKQKMIDGYISQKVKSSLIQLLTAIMDDLGENPNTDGSTSPNIQHWIEQKQARLKEFISNLEK